MTTVVISATDVGEAEEIDDGGCVEVAVLEETVDVEAGAVTMVVEVKDCELDEA